MITKTEVLTGLTLVEQQEYAMWEKRIDDALATHNSRTIVPYNGSAKVKYFLVKAYCEKGGWEVGLGDDQRDGAWLSFQ